MAILEDEPLSWPDNFNQQIHQLQTLQSRESRDIYAILSRARKTIEQAFYQQIDIQHLLNAQSRLVDTLLHTLWQQHNDASGAPGITQQVAIVAVGGYGRMEMHPHSDIDLLILLQGEPDTQCQSAITHFITQLWDLKLDIGHSVRTLDECVDMAENDLTVITNLIEARYLCGNEALLDALQDRLSPKHLWDAEKFFQAKLGEQQERYKRYGDTAYRVEPNLKDGPGGLRDIHMISWVTKRAYNTLYLHELYEQQLLTENEFNSLIESRDFLWKVRYAMHLLARRKEDRLLLEHQQSLAKLFGYHSKVTNEAVEQFMQHYYRVITHMERMNELLLGIFRENILTSVSDEPLIVINDWCIRKGNYLAISQNDIFDRQPHTLLEIFYILQTTSGIRGLTPSTIRQIHSHLPMIDENYRMQSRHKQLFIAIMSESHGITYVLRRMNRYGILAAWIPAFANIVGRMQFDLFHAYTVDDHTLRVIRMIRRNSVPRGAEDMPYESLIFKSLPDPKLLYLAGLFHDIAKGRGGSHSELGAKDAYAFCRLHELNTYDAHLVSWLVENHLILSMTAQQKDISDPEVIQSFAQRMIDPVRLDYLYLLTIADIRGTNPDLWNGWKHSLLQGLYKNTRKVLKHGISPASYAELVKQKRESVCEQLPMHGISKENGKQYCDRMGDDYLLNHSIDIVLWQMSHIQRENVYPIIQLRTDTQHDTMTLFIYTHGTDELFAQTTAVLGKLGISVVAAYIMHTPNGFSLETLQIFGDENLPLDDLQNQQQLISALRHHITPGDHTRDTDYSYKVPRRLKAFDVKTVIHIDQDTSKQQTKISIRTIDFPGLLAKLSRIFYELHFRVVGARIATLGEEVEDIFYLTDLENQPVTDENSLQNLRHTLTEAIDTIDNQ